MCLLPHGPLLQAWSLTHVRHRLEACMHGPMALLVLAEVSLAQDDLGNHAHGRLWSLRTSVMVCATMKANDSSQDSFQRRACTS